MKTAYFRTAIRAALLAGTFTAVAVSLATAAAPEPEEPQTIPIDWIERPFAGVVYEPVDEGARP